MVKKFRRSLFKRGIIIFIVLSVVLFVARMLMDNHTAIEVLNDKWFYMGLIVMAGTIFVSSTMVYIKMEPGIREIERLRANAEKAVAMSNRPIANIITTPIEDVTQQVNVPITIEPEQPTEIFDEPSIKKRFSRASVQVPVPGKPYDDSPYITVQMNIYRDQYDDVYVNLGGEWKLVKKEPVKNGMMRWVIQKEE